MCPRRYAAAWSSLSSAIEPLDLPRQLLKSTDSISSRDKYITLDMEYRHDPLGRVIRSGGNYIN